MALSLDHIVIAVQDLDTAVEDYRDLGFSVVRGGFHANRATHNALIGFADGTYLELLAATGEPPIPGLIDFSVLLHRGEGLAGFALRSDNLEADARRLRNEGFAVGQIMPGERRRADGTVIRWELALLDGGFAPFLIHDITPHEWRVPADSAITAHANRSAGLRGIRIAVRDIEAARERYTRLFGAESLPQPVVSVVLGEVDQPYTLDAVLLMLESVGDDRLVAGKTHGVRFQAG